jgi:hypothetical protein
MIYKAVLVNPWDRKVTWIDYDEGQKLASLITHPSNPVDTLDIRMMARDVQMVVDDSAGQKPDIPIFRLSRYSYPIPGLALFLGVGDHGQTIDVRSNFLGFLASRVEFGDQVTTGRQEPTRETEYGVILGNLILKKKS